MARDWEEQINVNIGKTKIEVPSSPSAIPYPVREEPCWLGVNRRTRIEGTLELIDASYARSGMHFIWRDTYTDNRFMMFATDFMDIIPLIGTAMGNGPKVHGTWMFVKRGDDVGIKWAG